MTRTNRYAHRSICAAKMMYITVHRNLQKNLKVFFHILHFWSLQHSYELHYNEYRAKLTSTHTQTFTIPIKVETREYMFSSYKHNGTNMSAHTHL